MMKSNQKRGVSLIETVVVLAVLMLAVSILGPLILDSRERIRTASCANNLRWMSQAWLLHESSQNHLPSSGWGWRWTADPHRGFGKQQPGGWAYDMVRYTEHEWIANAGLHQSLSRKAELQLEFHASPIPMFYCPARRPAKAYPMVRNGFYAHNLKECEAGSCDLVRSDYQANSGNVALGETSGPPDSDSYPASFSPEPYSLNSTGVTFQVSETRLAQMHDGLGKTMLAGEKYLNPNEYHDGTGASDMGSAYMGLDRDVNGYTAAMSFSANTPGGVVNEEYLPRRDRTGLSLWWAFGSAHQRGFNTTFCDGTVRFLSFEIEPNVFWLMGGRSDGIAPIPPDQ